MSPAFSIHLCSFSADLCSLCAVSDTRISLSHFACEKLLAVAHYFAHFFFESYELTTVKLKAVVLWKRRLKHFCTFLP